MRLLIIFKYQLGTLMDETYHSIVESIISKGYSLTLWTKCFLKVQNPFRLKVFMVKNLSKYNFWSNLWRPKVNKDSENVVAEYRFAMLKRHGVTSMTRNFQHPIIKSFQKPVKPQIILCIGFVSLSSDVSHYSALLWSICQLWMLS